MCFSLWYLNYPIFHAVRINQARHMELPVLKNLLSSFVYLLIFNCGCPLKLKCPETIHTASTLHNINNITLNVDHSSTSLCTVPPEKSLYFL